MLPLGYAQNLSKAFFIECIDHFSCLNQVCPIVTSAEEDEYDQRFVEIGIETDAALPYPFKSDHRCYGSGDPCAYEGAIF